MGGGDRARGRARCCRAGPSPRGRGRRSAWRDRATRTRSIPAWAGATAVTWSSLLRSAVHPRVGGGDVPALAGVRHPVGPSPRGRGRRSRRGLPTIAPRSIPAWAGATPTLPRETRHEKVHPRVGGGDPPARWGSSSARGPSPRGRGRRAPKPAGGSVSRSIPAWAGATAVTRSSCWRSAVHPRVGGGDSSSARVKSASVGPSPRGRGRLARAVVR